VCREEKVVTAVGARRGNCESSDSMWQPGINDARYGGYGGGRGIWTSSAGNQQVILILVVKNEHLNCL